jgi:hypothetical protein
LRSSPLHSSEPLESFARIKPNGVSKCQKLDHIDLTLPAFNGGNKRLISTKLLRDIGLRESRLLATNTI